MRLKLSIVISGWILAYFLHEFFIPSIKQPLLLAISDSATHGLIATLMVTPFFTFNKTRIAILSLAVTLAIFIDLDHIFAAGSTEVTKMIALSTRPITHSLFYAIVIGIITTALIKIIYKTESFIFIFYSCFVALSSHIMRDAIDSKGTFWAHPFNAPVISETVFFGIFIGVNIVSLYFVYYLKNGAKKNTFIIEI